ncbi:uncharacterized protein [Diabrotica undecimpunctata]|uniref:uncharacterized protein n=1 Tax=Diabrotica undecimpunctata TaxID=50387 RepID=UPI003B6319F8
MGFFHSKYISLNLQCFGKRRQTRISIETVNAIKLIILSLRSNARIMDHRWLVRPEGGLHNRVVQEFVQAIQRGDIRTIQTLLDTGYNLRACQALYTYLSRLEDPLIPLPIQSLVLDGNEGVPATVVASDIMGLINQELSENRAELISLILYLMDMMIQFSPADELQGNTWPASMLPIFFDMQSRHMVEWRRIATIFFEMIKQAGDYL